jgi:phosphoribosylamine--glycine ligase
MRILVIGNGGREHALAWKSAQSPEVERVYVAPGNPGTAREPKVVNVPIGALDFDGLVALVRRERIDLTLVGPEAPLVAGVRDRFDAEGLVCFGPSRAAAQLEASKAFAKSFLARHGIPTGAYAAFTDADTAIAHVRVVGAPIVVKADGLAAGKGVVVARTVDEATDAIRDMLALGTFGEAGRRVVIEEFLEGEEASFICIADGGCALPFASSQDHKTRDDGDRGPNTGGLGAYSPAPVVTMSVHDRVMREIVEPTIRGMAAEGMAYQGFLYVGLMIDGSGQPRVIEFNCRFGDPECQPVLMRLKSDLVPLCQAALAGRLAQAKLEWDTRAALGVVMAAGGYPGEYRRGDPIEGVDAVDGEDLKVFHAGTRQDGDRLVTDGGRVLTVVGLGADVAAAQRRAYEGVGRIRWRDAYFRRDIGYRALARNRA